uniref:Uncharacterized protein n=1 Tax=Cacopsylla melanoneura TaxID=428564 RepID=A0A8D8SZS6_9HEMI
MKLLIHVTVTTQEKFVFGYLRWVKFDKEITTITKIKISFFSFQSPFYEPANSYEHYFISFFWYPLNNLIPLLVIQMKSTEKILVRKCFFFGSSCDTKIMFVVYLA